MSEKPFQDHWKQNQCWGCGNNEHGLQIKSYWEGDESVCVWKPHKHHMAGPVGVLNGGVIATLIDCHSVCTAIANEYKGEKRDLDSQPAIWCVTVSLKVDYLKPTPIDTALKLRASILKKEGRKIWLCCDVFSNKLKTVKAEVLAVRVNPDDWF